MTSGELISGGPSTHGRTPAPHPVLKGDMTNMEIVPATADEARALTDRIKVAVEGTWHLIQQAYLTRAWSALGYNSWDDYCTREFGTSRLRLPREERQEVVASLREIGMSTRAIAAATGNSKTTVIRELSGGPIGPPDFPPAETPASIPHIASIQGERTTHTAPERPAPARPLTPAESAERAITSERGVAYVQAQRAVTGTDGKTYPQPAPRPSQKPRTDVVSTVNRALQRAQDAAQAADGITRQHLAERKEEAAVWARNLSNSVQSLQRLLDLLMEDQ